MSLMFVIQSDNFKGKLVDLIGKTRSDLEAYGSPLSQLEPNGQERLFWEERAYFQETDEDLDLRFIARLYQGMVWAVGICSEKYFALLRFNAQGSPYFEVVPKPPGTDPGSVNWIAKGVGGLHNLGYSR